MGDGTVHNLLVGSHDMSGAVFGDKGRKSAETFHGAGVATLGVGRWGIRFDTSHHLADARATSGVEYSLSFWARADVAGDKVHSEVWGSRYVLDATLGTGWRLVTMPYGIVRADERTVFLWGPDTNSGDVHVALPMANRGTTPAAWAPAEGEGLPGGGAQMSANLWTPNTNHAPNPDGTYTVGKKGTAGLQARTPGMATLAESQTVHMGASLRGAGSGSVQPYVEYADAAGHKNWVGFPIWTPTDSWKRFEGSCVVPSGMAITALGFDNGRTTGNIDVANPTFSYGSPVTLASDAHTPYATQGHLAAEYATKAALRVTSDAVQSEVTERGRLAGRVGTLESTTGTHTSKLAQLAASVTSLVRGESTYTDPDGKSATSGIYSLVEQTRDSVTALFGGYTKTADLASTAAVRDAKQAGTDAASTADAAKAAASKAQSTADGAKSTADGLATMIRQDSSGVTVGKSADGETWSTGRTRMTADGLDVLDKAGKLLARFGAKVIELGRDSPDAAIDLLGGLARIKATNDGASGDTWCKMMANALVSVEGYYASRIIAGYKDERGFVPKGVAGVSVQGGDSDVGVMLDASMHGGSGNSFAMSPDGYMLNHPEYLAAALLGTGGDGLGGTTDGVATASDLNACGPGVWSYGSSTANRPTDWGVCLSFAADNGNWLFQLALPTIGEPCWRRNVNGGGWTAWWQFTTA
jgi:hypothetical protein